MSNIRIAIVDDHNIVRDGISSLIEDQPGFEIITKASNGKEIVQFCEKIQPDIIIMDITMPVMDGIEATDLIKDKYPKIKILALTMVSENEYIRKMIKAGASGYILKSSGRSELIEALNALMNDEHYFSDDATQTILKDLIQPEASNMQAEVHITDRELEVLKLIADEFTNQEIADKLYISVRTVDAHRRNLLQKVGAKNTAGLVRYALEHDLIK